MNIFWRKAYEEHPESSCTGLVSVLGSHRLSVPARDPRPQPEPRARHTLIHNEAKAPTCVNNGILEHRYCPGCNARFSDEAATTEVTFADLEVEENGHVAGADDGDCTTALGT